MSMSKESKSEKKQEKKSNNLYISSREEDDDTLKFTIKNIDVSIANSIRRTILGDIVILGFRAFPHEKNDIDIQINTSRLNNEILKQRISCIPVFKLKEDDPYDTLLIELDEINDSDEIKYITTEHFKIKDTKLNKYLDDSIVKKIFPPDQITNDFIIISRLLPKFSPNKSGEQLKLNAKLSLNSAKDDGVYNVTSCCCYMNTPDKIRQDDLWNEKLKNLTDEENEPSKLKILKSDWINHHSKRVFINNSFDFKITSIGIFNNVELVKKTCDILINKLDKLKTDISTPETFSKMLHSTSNSTIPNSFDITLFNEDYTLGKVIEFFLHDIYYIKKSELSYVGFRKNHPHDSHSIIRMAFKKNITIGEEYSLLKTILNDVSDKAIEIYNNIIAEFE